MASPLLSRSNTFWVAAPFQQNHSCLSRILRPRAVDPIWGLRPDFYYCQTNAGSLMWVALSDERAGRSFTTSAGPSQRSHFRVRIPWDSWPYFTLTDSRLPFSSPPTTCRATVEVFDPASTRDIIFITPLHWPNRKHRFNSTYVVACVSVAAGTCLPSRCLEPTIHATVSKPWQFVNRNKSSEYCLRMNLRRDQSNLEKKILNR
jgi:hypothetical protein